VTAVVHERPRAGQVP